MVSPREVLDLQADLAERLEHPDLPLAQYLNEFSELELGHKNQLSINMFGYALSGRSYRVASNMNAEIYRRAWEDDTVALPWSASFGDFAPPRHRGFVVFEEPLRIPEARGRDQFVHAAVWGFGQDFTGQRGWMVTLWGDLKRDVDDVMATVLHKPSKRRKVRHFIEDSLFAEGMETYYASYGRWAPVSVQYLRRDRRLGPAVGQMNPAQQAKIIAEGDTPLGIVRSTHRIIPALWSLLTETRDIEEQAEPVATPRVRSSSGTQRVMRSDEVRTIVLRRPSRPTQEPGTGKKRDQRCWVEGGYYQTFWTGPGRKIPVRRLIGGHWSVADESLPIKNRPTVMDLRH